MERESQRELGDGVAAEQRAGAGEAGATEAEEHVQEALYSLCSCRRPEPSCSGARETAARRNTTGCEDNKALLVHEERLDRES